VCDFGQRVPADNSGRHEINCIASGYTDPVALQRVLLHQVLCFARHLAGTPFGQPRGPRRI